MGGPMVCTPWGVVHAAGGTHQRRGGARRGECTLRGCMPRGVHAAGGTRQGGGGVLYRGACRRGCMLAVVTLCFCCGIV